MIVPIFNSMARIEQARRRGGDRCGRQPLRYHAADHRAARQKRHRARFDFRGLDRDGRFLRHQGDVAAVGVGVAPSTRHFVLQYPGAAASAIVLTVILLVMVSLILRSVDIRKESPMSAVPQSRCRRRRARHQNTRSRQAAASRPWTFYVLAGLFTFYVIRLYGR